MQAAPNPQNLKDQVQEIAELLLAGGTPAGLYGLDAKDLEAAYALGYSLYNQARWTEAVQVFSFLTYQDPLDRRFHLGRAASLQMAGQHENALHAYGLAFVMDVLDPAVALRIAECQIALHRKDDARAALEGVVELTDDAPQHAAIRTHAQALMALIQH